MNTKFYLTYGLLLITYSLFAQFEKQAELAKQYLQQNKAKWNLAQQDIADLDLYNAYQTKHNKVTHLYFNQQYTGIPIYNAIYNANLLPNGKVFFTNNRFHSDIINKVNTTRAILSPEEAIATVIDLLAITTSLSLKEKEIDGKRIRYKQSNISDNDLTVQLIYQPTKEGKLQLAWQIEIDMLTTSDYWNIRIDAQNGELLKKDNYTVYCTFPNHQHTAGEDCGYLHNQSRPTNQDFSFYTNNSTDGSRYNVFPVPVESPIHGERRMVEEPALLSASPFGWHDTDGVAGPEFTITRGNNVHAYADLLGTNRSTGNEPDGGSSLEFDFNFNNLAEPLVNQEAAVTQLFYMSNVMHDLAYQYGFDEVAGSFQQNNYGKGGLDGDFVISEALDSAGVLAADSLLREPPLNNANFAPSPDGSRGRLQMFVWDQSGGKIVSILEPEAIAADFEGFNASFGPSVLDEPVSGTVVAAFDNSPSPSLACEPLVNAAEIEGNIALIDRGSCFFVDKIRNAQAAGAIAVIVCNFEDRLVRMGAPNGAGTADITIPSVFIQNSDCQIFKQVLDEGLTVRLGSLAEENTGPSFLSGSFDNGIVAHEYAHGISHRLVGGSGRISCLSNEEQMGEGWSDFFSLITSVQAGDRPEDIRGVGSYALRQGTEGNGIRRFPYSTNLDITEYTYADIAGQGVHELGAVWTAMLWDLYWAMSDEHGWDPDPFNGTGGNNMAIQLVMDGMKLTTCSPGFVDARDAILAADEANYGGANQCLIWKVFARRGLGFNASQGSTNSNSDGVESFDALPQCIQELKIAKTVSDLINPGEDIAVNLQVVNHKGETVTDVMVSDILPEGVTLNTSSIAFSASNAPADFPYSSSDEAITIELGDMAQDDTINISYTLNSSSNQASIQQYFDGGENGDDIWLYIDRQGSDLWALTDDFPRSGDYSWSIENTANENRQILQLDEPIGLTGNFPVLRFYHWYNTEPRIDGGFIEISTDGGTAWENASPYFLRNGYSGEIPYSTFAEPDLQGFWGDSGEYIPTYIDLRAFLEADDILIRFRFGSDNNNPDSYTGWFIDDIEVLDLLSYNSEACATSAEGDRPCAVAPEGGTFVEVGQFITSVEDLEDQGLLFKVFPNPAGDFLNISLSHDDTEEGTVTLFNMNGQALLQQAITLQAATQVIPVNVGSLAKGFYFVEVRTTSGVAMKKVVLE